ncbi:hypothetical protein EYF80_019584 [Liparis tanakae]|uniref:Uncharacterized protein n=1 Tax=Liparis tanakae TaxID=230148 RepID=A0A4Z2HZ05_9TELE|nr:hypothetical protein EYF80_019584 [Liparis tanakae]
MEDANRIEEKLENESGGDQGTSEGNKTGRMDMRFHGGHLGEQRTTEGEKTRMEEINVGERVR